MPEWPVSALTRADEHWPALVAHITRVGQVPWAGLDDPSPDRHYLAVLLEDAVVGHISLLVSDLSAPQTEPDDAPFPLVLHGRVLRETWVETFAVEDDMRRRGIGRALQLAALDLTRRLDCYQMHSWSTLDKAENYALKLSLGFAAHPGIHTSRDGRQFAGVYFVKVV